MFYEELLEHDLNPFILFDSNGKLKKFNNEAEFLFNFISPKELFDLAVAYASTTFGFRREFIKLQFEKQSFYAILVGYITEDEIILRLYKEMKVSRQINIDKKFQEVNVFTLIDLSKETTMLNTRTNIENIYDISIPDIKLNINEFLITMNSIFSQLKLLKLLLLKVHVRVGEHEIINNKKYSILAIEFTSKEKISFDFDKLIDTDLNVFFNYNIIRLEIPMIIDKVK